MMIEVKSLSKKFGEQWALKNTTWSVKDKRSLGLLGPNGAGKSTSMKIMTGLLCSTEGEVLIDGHNIMTEPIEAKKKIGYLPETPPLYDEIKVLDFLYFICGIKNLPKSDFEKNVDSAIEKMNLNEVAYKPIRVLSKGFRQRVGIAQTLIGDPSILILDEPSVGLDPHQVYELRNIIKGLKKDHIIILSTHILCEVQQVCDDVVILDKGEVKAQGSIETLLNKERGDLLFEIRLRRFDESMRSRLDQFPEVNRIEYSDNTLEVSLSGSDEAQIDSFIGELASLKCGIQSVQQKHQQLEDVFIEVTK